MSNVRVSAVTQEPVPSTVVSFAELSCFNHLDQLRVNPLPVVFRLFSVGRGLGKRVDVEFTDDYSLYYQPDDDLLIAALTRAAPTVAWAGMMYHRWLDQSRIQVVNPERGNIVAQIETRRYYGRKITEAGVLDGEYGGNLVSMAELRRLRTEKLAAAAVIEAEKQAPAGE